MVLDGDYYVRRNVRLSVSDMFKIRYDNEWEDEDDAPMNFGAEADMALAPADGSVYMAAALVSNGGGNISVSVDGEYDIYFNVTLGYLHVRPAGSDAPGDIAWGLTGSFTDWAPGEDLQMTAAEGSGQEYYVYEGLVVDETATFKFRYGNMFKNGSDNVFGLPSGTSGPVALNVPVNLDADGAAADLEIAAGTYNMVLYPTQRVAYVIEQNAGINVPDRITWGISGTMTGWADNMDILMTQSGGYYVAENIHVPAGAEFKFRYGNNWNGNNYGFPANESVAASDNVLALVSGGTGNLTVQAEGDYDFYLNPDYGFLYVKTAGSPAPAAVSFGINAGITADMPDLTMIQSGNEFVCTNVRFPESDAFRIRISNNDGLVYGGTWAGTDVAIDSADVVLMNSKLTDVSAAIRLSRAVLRNIHENLFWAFFYNLICIPLAAGLYGWKMSPMVGAAAMSLSSVTVCLNALRLNLFHMHDARHDHKMRRKHKHEETTEESTEETKEIAVQGMMCEHCENAVQKALLTIDGITDVKADHVSGKVTYVFTKPVDENEIAAKIEEAGYTVVSENKEETNMTKTMKVTGMMCAHCEARVEKALNAIDGVASCKADHNANEVKVELSKDVDDAVLKKAVEDQDYTVEGIN